MNSKIVFLVAVILLLPSVFAFDCDLTSDSDYCITVVESDLNESEKDQLISFLLYSEQNYPNHTFIKDYNLQVEVEEPPYNTTIYDSVQIKNAWLSFLSIFPAVYENDTLYVTPTTGVLCEYDYDVYIPPNYYSSGYPHQSGGDCKRIYSLVQNDASVKHYLDDIYKGSGKYTEINTNTGLLESILQINTQLKVDHYHRYSYCCRWYKGSCRRYCHKCKYYNTGYEPDEVIISENKSVELYSAEPYASLTITNSYYNTTKGVFTASNFSLFRLGFNESYIIQQKYYYDLVFDKKPYYFAYLKANNFSRTTQKNILLSNDTFFIKNTANCSLFAYNHFNNFSSDCDLTLEQEELEELNKEERDFDYSFLVFVIIFLFVLYVIYKLLKSQMKKIVIPLILILLLIPFVSAEDPPEECGITNLASCIPQKMYEFFIVLINAPLLPMLVAIQGLLTADVSIGLFQHIWSIIRYIIGFFYIFLFLYSGYTFLTSNANPIKRAHAKDMLKDTILMIVLIQGSFYIYDLILSLSSIMDNAILQMIDPYFFLITADNLVNIGLEFIFVSAYAMTLFVTLIMLALRYIIVSFGVVLFPIGLFCYFIPPLKGYGRFIIHMLGIFIFVTFIDLLLILACSMLVEIPLFENFKILVMINCFGIVNYTLYLGVKFAIKRSTNGSLKDDIGQAMKYVAMLV